ncbi:MAG: insulinase family protein [Gemmataceae bacterium]|nr:insulinase family protein [Gemmataceae bacterium]
MPASVYSHTFPNGLTLLCEPMSHVRSAALNILVPAGCVYDPPANAGIGSLVSELITRGAGDLDSRALTLAFDNLGLDRSESVGSIHMRFAAATLARNLNAALELYSDVLLRPHLPEDELEPVQMLALQDLQGLEDEPRQKALLELRRRHYPAPLSNDRMGTAEGIKATTIEKIRKHWSEYIRPNGAIISVAGNVEWEPLRDLVGRLFAGWQAGEDHPLTYGSAPGGSSHITKDTAQTQIGIAYPSVPFGHADYYAAMGAVNILSGGMSSRLFTHVREERGLCYAVWASYATFRDRGSVLAYAGTTTERAQETLDVTVRELKRLVDGIEADEVDRVKAGLKSSLIMQEESTGARAASIASDWYYLNRVRTFDEIQSAIDGLTPDSIIGHLKRYPAKDFTMVTLGREPLKIPE